MKLAGRAVLLILWAAFMVMLFELFKPLLKALIRAMTVFVVDTAPTFVPVVIVCVVVEFCYKRFPSWWASWCAKADAKKANTPNAPQTDSEKVESPENAPEHTH